MSFLNDVINTALREDNVPQMGSSGTARLIDAVRSLLAPRSTQSTSPADEAHIEPEVLQELLARFEQSGYADIVRSWIGTGENQAIEPHQLKQVLGSQKVDELSRQTGVAQHTLLDELAGLLPKVIDRLTPQGRLSDGATLPPRR